MPNQTSIPNLQPEEPVTLDLKKDLRQRNKIIFKLMQKILLVCGRFGDENTVENLQAELKEQVKQFLDICARANKAELRYLRLREIEEETSQIRKRTSEICG